jgi:hypothetical protein
MAYANRHRYILRSQGWRRVSKQWAGKGIMNWEPKRLLEVCKETNELTKMNKKK